MIDERHSHLRSCPFPSLGMVERSGGIPLAMTPASMNEITGHLRRKKLPKG
ncbi:hypothetical protein Isop_0785 [Isosphaera pallida ATCC 43644]|uniref:Uncharacterized protein n=1 Tax=Isosphaera pallida (strain ATCC 43644 / DSM 9630 / IS1B) TaxID=575540 RepID=E8R1V4_ISOPI|nr:hypothetical protein Isop_0785 [Isosphaera pallida ATCC 43644]